MIPRFLLACAALLLAGLVGSTQAPAPKLEKKPLEKLEAKPLEFEGYAILRGNVTYDGDPPAPQSFAVQVGMQMDKQHCTKGDITDPCWKVRKQDKAIANVVVWLKPPRGYYFKPVPKEKKTWPDEVIIDQPFCAFEPHVAVVYSHRYDPEEKQLVPTGQACIVRNSAPITHNVKYTGDRRIVPGENITMRSGEKWVLKEQPDNSTPIWLCCDIHKWMTAYVWSLDTPYAAVTGTDGTYEIAYPPAAELQIVLWHEVAGFFGEGGAAGKKIKLAAGANVLDFKVKAK